MHSGQCTKVDPVARPAVAGLLGCGVVGGVGSAINTGQAGRGDAVAVFGCGGVGTGAVAGANLTGAAEVIAVDTDDPKKLDWAVELGATRTVDASVSDTVAAVRELTGGNDADVVVEAVGRPETYEKAF